MKKSVPTRTSMCERIKSFQEMACFLLGQERGHALPRHKIYLFPVDLKVVLR